MTNFNTTEADRQERMDCETGRFPLHQAVYHEDFLKIQKLLTFNPDVITHCTDRMQRTPLHTAASIGNIAIVNLLLDKRSALEAKDIDGKTPLYLAVENGFLALVQYLIGIKHANFRVRSVGGKHHLFHVAAKRNYFSILEYLWMHLVSMEVSDRMELLDAQDFENTTPCMLAIQNRNFKIAHFLIKQGINTCLNNKEKETALTLAAWEGAQGLFQRILKNRVTANNTLMLPEKHIVLYCAIQGKNLEIFKALIRLDVLKLIINRFELDPVKQWRTPLHYAAVLGQKEVVQSLLEAGADLSVTDKAGKTALDYARCKNHECVIDILLSHPLHPHPDTQISSDYSHPMRPN